MEVPPRPESVGGKNRLHFPGEEVHPRGRLFFHQYSEGMAEKAGTASRTETARAGRVARTTLNSRRLTAVVLKRVVKVLGLPTAAALDDLRQMIDGKLVEDGEDPMSVQVVQIETEEGVTIELRNPDGYFLTMRPEADTAVDDKAGAESGDRGDVRLRGGSETASPVLSEDDTDPRVTHLQLQIARMTEQNAALTDEVSELKKGITGEKARYRELWRINCEQLRERDDLIAERDGEIEVLKTRIARLESSTIIASASSFPGRDPPPDAHSPISSTRGIPLEVPSPTMVETPALRRGKAPPIDPFDGETGSVSFEDWLPTLQRAAVWNNWSDNDCLVQLAGHLRKKALQEWNLLTEDEKKTFVVATDALQNRLDPNSRVLAAQEFRHAVQRTGEPVSEYIRRLEQTYRRAYGRDKMSSETRDTLLFSQLQEGLQYELVKAPAVSGAQGYQQLCLAARNEERRLLELDRRRQYSKVQASVPLSPWTHRQSQPTTFEPQAGPPSDAGT